jgi:hypothetical protein
LPILENIFQFFNIRKFEKRPYWGVAFQGKGEKKALATLFSLLVCMLVSLPMKT